MAGKITIMTMLLMLLLLEGASAVDNPSNTNPTEPRAANKANRPDTKTLKENLAKLDTFMKAVDLAVVTLNSYIAAFSNILK
jgi:PBP1b-binding outer membrane lipoprotein LpoB